jgi:ribonucleoside-triphosphate reductase
MGEGNWFHSDKFSLNDSLRGVIKHETLSYDFIGWTEILDVRTGKHHGDSNDSLQDGLMIIKYVREREQMNS